MAWTVSGDWLDACTCHVWPVPGLLSVQRLHLTPQQTSWRMLGVLHSDEFLALSLLLLGSLSLMMSYWRQKSAITPERDRNDMNTAEVFN